ncbi:hypothetical protein VB10N_46730 [Vibrio sp. 10N]|nr:hypothetical protein VB10N_46730 [Vibrio sp. 10N]
MLVTFVSGTLSRFVGAFISVIVTDTAKIAMSANPAYSFDICDGFKYLDNHFVILAPNQ